VSDTLELYRVKDIETRQPFLIDCGGIENVQLNTSDTSPVRFSSEAMPASCRLGDKVGTKSKRFVAKRRSRNRRE